MPELYATEQSHQAIDWLRNGVTRRPNEQAVFAVMYAAAASTLPGWARAELNLSTPAPFDLLFDTVAVIPAARALSAALRWVATAQNGPGNGRPGADGSTGDETPAG